MSARPPQIEEVQRLADAVFDGVIDAKSLQSLEELITSDLACLQAYVERIGLHGDLIKQSIERCSGHDALLTIDRVLAAQERIESRQHRIVYFALACSIVILVTAGWLMSLPRAKGPEMGVISNLTVDQISESSSFLLGQVLRPKTDYVIQGGMATVKLPHAIIDAVGPTKWRFLDKQTIELKRGILHLDIQEGGTGFTIITPDGIVEDYGTRFLVEYSSSEGTGVSVQSGRVHVGLKDFDGNISRNIDLTMRRALRLSSSKKLIQEVGFIEEKFRSIEAVRGNIVSIDGTIRTMTVPPQTLLVNQHKTRNHVLIFPELQNVILTEDMVVDGLEGNVRFPAGTVLNSYLLHYDPDELTTQAPRGGVTFDGKIAAVLGGADSLSKSDKKFGLPDLQYGPQVSRELELDEDEVQVSEDRRTLSVYFGASGAEALDQVRVLVYRNQ